MIANIFRKIRLHFFRVLNRKRMAHEVVSSDFPMKVGDWKIGVEFSCHRQIESLPPPLNLVKQWGGWRTGRILKKGMTLLETVVPPYIAHKEEEVCAEYLADIILVARLGNPIGFDVASKKVIKLANTIDLKLLGHNRDSLSPIYECAKFELSSCGKYVFEEMVQGVAFSYIEKEKKKKFVVDTFYKTIAAQEHELESSKKKEWFSNIAILVSKLRCQESTKSSISKNLNFIMSSAKVTWGHGDLFGENVLYTQKKFKVIDYDLAGVSPAFTDLMTLMIYEARNLKPDVLEQFVFGEYDSFFTSLRVIDSKTDNIEMARFSCYLAWLAWKLITEEFCETNLNRFHSLILTFYSDYEISIYK